jgi:preprotein translocase subunit SecE
MATQTTTAVQPGGGFGTWLKGVREYIEELKTEMRRVTWPSRKQVQATTAVVVVSVFMFAAYFALVDAVLGNTINTVFHKLATR